jgi:23S rRNA-/tRNA-specific pseudouridylate synthase
VYAGVCKFNPDNDFAKEDQSDIKKAVTKVTVLKSRRLASLIALEPLTGRKHQLRVHCASILKSYILGDFKYGQGFTKEFRHQLTKPMEKSLPLHLHLYRVAIKNWYGPGNDLRVVAPIDHIWRKVTIR